MKNVPTLYLLVFSVIISCGKVQNEAPSKNRQREAKRILSALLAGIDPGNCAIDNDTGGCQNGGSACTRKDGTAGTCKTKARGCDCEASSSVSLEDPYDPPVIDDVGTNSEGYSESVSSGSLEVDSGSSGAESTDQRADSSADDSAYVPDSSADSSAYVPESSEGSSDLDAYLSSAYEGEIRTIEQTWKEISAENKMAEKQSQDLWSYGY